MQATTTEEEAAAVLVVAGSGGNKVQYLEQRVKEHKRLRLEQDKIDDGGRKQLGEDAGASSGALCGDERGGLHAVMAGEGPGGRSIGW